MTKGCNCDFYDDTETFQQLNRQANDPSYAARMLDAGVVGRALNCDRCECPRQAHERLEARRIMPEYMPNGGVVAIEWAARKSLAKRAARFPDLIKKEEPSPKVECTDVKVGTGNLVEFDSEVLCSYKATFDSDNSQFEQNDEFRFKVGASAVINGLDEGVRGMNVGGIRTVRVPPQFAYGVDKVIDGRKGETLVFVVNVLAAVRS